VSKRGKVSKIGAADRLLILLVYLTHYETFNKSGATFGLSAAQISDVVHAAAEATAPALITKYVKTLSHAEQDVLDALQERFPEVCVMADTTFQETFKPTGTYLEAKRSYSGKHKAYGLKSQVVHAMNGSAMHFLPGFAGSTADITIMREPASLQAVSIYIPLLC
jgi:hypothetical protein